MTSEYLIFIISRAPLLFLTIVLFCQGDGVSREATFAYFGLFADPECFEGPAPARLDPTLLSSLLRSSPWGAGSVPRAPPVVLARNWATSALTSPPSKKAPPHRAFGEVWRAVEKAPASSPLPGAGEPLRTSPTTLGAEDGPGRAFKLARERGA